MTVSGREKGSVFYLTLSGEMDEYGASRARRTADEMIGRTTATKIVFSLENISFMDSTGIGFLLGRYKTAKRLGIKAYIAEPSFATDKILALSGVYSLIPKCKGEGA